MKTTTGDATGPGSGGDERPSLVRFPAAESVRAGTAFDESVFGVVDEALQSGECYEGRLEIEGDGVRLTCLVHQGRPYLAGLLEDGVFSRVPLIDLPLRARQLEGASWRLLRTEAPVVMMLGVHFCKQPDLQGSTRWIDLQHVLEGLAADRSDAAVALERDRMRTLMFLHQGVPARIFFVDPADDPREGDIAERLLLYAFSPGSPEGHLEVFTNLKLPADDDAGRLLAELVREAQPPPPAYVVVRLASGRQLTQRPFLPPKLTIGRDPRADLFLDNLAVSRRHAELAWQRGAFVIRDLGSANGTRLNGQQVNSAPVETGDRVEIGKFEITVEVLELAAGTPDTMMLAVPHPPRPVYLVGDDVSLELRGDTVIGKGRGVDVVARGLLVRPVHARLHALGGAAFEVTSFGRARVRVNGEKMASGRLTLGDKLTVGRSHFWLRGTPADALVPHETGEAG